MVGCTEAGSLNSLQPSCFLNQKNCETGYKPASQCCPDFRLVDGNASIQQGTAVVVPIVERDGGWATSDLKSITRVAFQRGHSITGGAPLLTLFEKWLAELLAW
jgi:hypothetical protein